MEIGGGFGGMAYYLLRDHPGTTYVNFDTPESIALMSYYLFMAFPLTKGVLYGEETLSSAFQSRARIILLPLFDMPNLLQGSVDVTFSSNSLSDVSPSALNEYLHDIDRSTKGTFIYIGKRSAADLIAKIVEKNYPRWNVVESRDSEWHNHRVRDAHEVERVYKTLR